MAAIPGYCTNSSKRRRAGNGAAAKPKRGGIKYDTVVQ